MLGVTATDALAPVPEAACRHLLPHQPDYRLLREAVIGFNRLKRGTVFPGHLDNSGEPLI